MAAAGFRRRLPVLRWLIPILLLVVVAIYEMAQARLAQGAHGAEFHALVDTLIFGTVGPLLVYWLLDYLDRYLQEQETNDLQAYLVNQAQAGARLSRQLNDDAMQVLYSAGNLIESIKIYTDDLPPETREQIDATERALNQAIQNLRAHLMD